MISELGQLNTIFAQYLNSCQNKGLSQIKSQWKLSGVFPTVDQEIYSYYTKNITLEVILVK